MTLLRENTSTLITKAGTTFYKRYVSRPVCDSYYLPPIPMKLRISSVQVCSQHVVFILNILCTLIHYLYLIALELIISNTKSACFHYCHFTALKVHLFQNIFHIPNFFSKFCVKWQNSTYVVATSSKKLILLSSWYPESRLKPKMHREKGH